MKWNMSIETGKINNKSFLREMKSYLANGNKYKIKKNYFLAFLYYSMVIRYSERRKLKSEFYDMALEEHNSLFRRLFFNKGRLISINQNILLSNFRKEIKRIGGDELKKFKPEYYVKIIKKPKGGEKGIIFIRYPYVFLYHFDLKKLVKNYKIVIITIHCEYKHPVYYSFIGNEADVFIGAAYEPDYVYLKSLKTNLVPLKIGSGDFVKPFLIRNGKKRFDICTVGYNDYYKNFSGLIKLLGNVKNNHNLRIFFASKDKEAILKLAKKEGLKAKLTVDFYDRKKWQEILASSKVFILNSTVEGHNKTLTEALFANTPIMMNESSMGSNKDFFTKRTGFLYNSSNFEKKLFNILKNQDSFSPREWALKNTGWLNAYRYLNNFLKQDALKKGESWTQPLPAFPIW